MSVPDTRKYTFPFSITVSISVKKRRLRPSTLSAFSHETPGNQAFVHHEDCKGGI
jgi:hypothetical protein